MEEESWGRNQGGGIREEESGGYPAQGARSWSEIRGTLHKTTPKRPQNDDHVVAKQWCVPRGLGFSLVHK